MPDVHLNATVMKVVIMVMKVVFMVAVAEDVMFTLISSLFSTSIDSC